jgi:para-aminobenzoate synthetase / 4-amino-4-deoxychorismate lyase
METLPRSFRAAAFQNPNSVLLETARFDAANTHSYVFLQPLRLLIANRLDEIPGLFAEIESALQRGFYLAGFLAYECGYHFEPIDNAALSLEAPLAWLGVYDRPQIFDHSRPGGTQYPTQEVLAHALRNRFPGALGIPEDQYSANILKIKEYIAAGDTYQVNFTDSVSMRTTSSPADLFATLATRQPVSYSAFINMGASSILSFSPELFFRLQGGKIEMRPMKGTMARAASEDQDREVPRRLQNDAKNRSEHVMIVDLLRSDLGRICAPGTVVAEDLFTAEKYPTLYQMTSTVKGTLLPNLKYYDIFRGLFPSGSITGAPKIRTMQIIRHLERKVRGAYCGAIGFIAPQGLSVFSVAIRTLAMKDGVASMGVGGGIVAESDPREEYKESLLKAAFLAESDRSFKLIEALLWDGRLRFLSQHLDRLQSSATHFEFVFERGVIAAQLQELSTSLRPGLRYKIRLLLAVDGRATVQSTEFAPCSTVARVNMAAERTSSGDYFLQHKTTCREMYDRSYHRARLAGFDDTLFANERDEITEGAISNIFIEKGGQWYTPPLSSGVLPGIYRRYLLKSRAGVTERVLTLEDVRQADQLYICNAVRGLRKATLHLDRTIAAVEF